MPDDPIIEMARHLRNRVGLTSIDFDWPACAPGFRVEYQSRGGDSSIPDWLVASRIRYELERMEQIRMMPNNPDSILPEKVRQGTCRWEALPAWAKRTGAEILVLEIECVACHKKESVETAQTTVAIGHAGADLPIPGYAHCGSCMLRMDATEAWLLANAEAHRLIGRRA